MKSIYALTLLFLTIVSCTSQKSNPSKEGFLKGDLSPFGVDIDTLVLFDISKGKDILDSLPVIDGKFVYKHKTNEPKQIAVKVLYKSKTLGFLSFINPKSSPDISFTGEFYLENTETTISVDTTAKVLRPFGNFAVVINGSPETDVAFTLSKLYLEKKKVDFDLVKNNNKSYALLYEVSNVPTDYPLKEIEKMANAFDDKLKNSASYKSLSQYIANENKIKELGYQSGFPLKDTAGRAFDYNQVSKGKPLLLVFWASWCGPCIEEIPDLKEIQKKYGHKIELVSLSIDKDTQSWKNAVKKYQMPWLNLSALPEEPTRVLDYFGTKVIPTLILADSNGKLIKRTVNDLPAIKKEIEKL